MQTLKNKLLTRTALSFLITLTFCGLLFCGGALADKQTAAPPPAQEQPAVDPAANREAFLNFVQGSLESGFMDEWRGRRPMQSMEEVGEYLSTFNLWAYACQDAASFKLNAEEARLLAAFRQKAEVVQAEAFPKLRDAFGPILRQQIAQLQVSAVTSGQGFKTVRFSGQPFSAAANIDEFHDQVKIVLFQLRFEKAEYKAARDTPTLKTLPVSSLNDNELVVWVDDLKYEVVK